MGIIKSILILLYITVPAHRTVSPATVTSPLTHISPNVGLWVTFPSLTTRGQCLLTGKPTHHRLTDQWWYKRQTSNVCYLQVTARAFGYCRTQERLHYLHGPSKRRKSPNRIWPHLLESFSGCMCFTAGNNSLFPLAFWLWLMHFNCSQMPAKKPKKCLQWPKKHPDALSRRIRWFLNHEVAWILKLESTQLQWLTL